MPASGEPRRSSRLHLLCLFIVVFGVYAYTSPRTVAFEDDGGFVMAADLLGVAHPPGYPLFVLLAKPFTWIPLGETAWRVHLASACFGALAACMLWVIVQRLNGSFGIAHAAALCLAFGETLWSQAIVAEVYTLNLLVFLTLVALAQRYLESPRPARAAAMGLVLGLGLCNHWPLLLLAVPAVALLLWPQRSAAWRALPVALVAGALGLLPYAWMWLRASQEPALSYHGPFETPREFAAFVARRVYAGVESSPDADWWDKLRFAGSFGREWLRQYTAVGAGIALAGLVDGLRRRAGSWNLGLLVAFAGPSVLLLPLLDVEYDFHWRAVVRVYPLVSFAVTAIWLAEGLGWLRRRMPASLPPAAATGLGLALALALLARSWAINDRHDFHLAREAAATFLETLPANAVLFTHTDFDTFPAGYLHLVEGVRPDLALYNQQGAVFGNRLFGPGMPRSDKDRILSSFLRRSGRPVFFFDQSALPYGGHDYGFYVRLVPDMPGNARRAVIEPRLIALSRSFVAHLDHPDPWTRYYSQRVVIHMADFLTRALHEGASSPDPNAPHAADLEALAATHHGRFGRIRALSRLAGQDDAQLLEAALRVEASLDPEGPGEYRGAVHHLTGVLLERVGRRDEAARRYRAALDADPARPHETVLRLLALYAAQGDRAAYQALRARSVQVPEVRAAILDLDRELERNTAR